MEEIEWVPKERYVIMRESLKKKGALTYSMMKQTASIQISLDFTNEQDAIDKLRLAMGLSPILVAMFANSPIAEGKRSGFYSKRAYIWSQTAPERTGIIPQVFHPDFKLDDYIEYALEVPLLFIVRQDQWIRVENLRFGQFLKKGFEEHTATAEDWHLHLTTLFTEARLKQYLEIRSIDCQKKELGVSAPAFLKGLFYDEHSRKKAWELIADLSIEERIRLGKEAPIQGLATEFKGKTLLTPIRTLLKLAEEGLNRLAGEKLAGANEAFYLEPLKEILLDKKRTPAEVLLGCFDDHLDTQEKIKAVLKCAAI